MHPLKILRYAMAGWIPGGQRHCVICNHKVWRFMPYQSGSYGVPDLMHVLDLVGSNPDHFECPRCGAHDRERHLLMYLQSAGLITGLHGKDVLHFAPEKRLTPLIRATNPARYIRCDLFPNAPDIQRIDMMDIPFDTGTFDLVMANHVLEHVNDDTKALTEIHRVLKAGGIAILQTPYSRRLHWTWQDPGIDSAEACLQAYGQADHVRMFGRDIFDRIAAVGFESLIRQHSELLPNVDPVQSGVNPQEPLFLFRKPA
jgi:SAM-dependent methyltransferase